jgi:primosomal protein N'
MSILRRGLDCYNAFMKALTVYFCDIAPVIPIPMRNRQVFSYLSEAEIPRGSLVWIPFGPRTIQGIVLSCAEVARAEHASGRFKVIRSVVRESFLTDHQISLAEHISKECLTPFGKTLRHFLPPIVKERLSKTTTSDTEKMESFRLTEDERDVVRSLLENSDPKPFFLGADIEQSLRIIAGVKRRLGNGIQILVLVPEKISIPFTERFLLERFGAKRIASINSTLGNGAYFSAWERIRSGEADIIIGTRQALFSPFKKLGLIAMLEEAETVGYKQWDMSPRYDARRAAAALASLHRATLLLAGSVQGLDTTLREQAGEIRVLHIGDGLSKPMAPVTMIDMRKERWKKNYSIFSEELRDAIRQTRTNGRQVLLITNKGGLDSFSVCVSCKEVPRCPDCDRALRSTRDGSFRCPACPYTTKSFPRCTKCGSLEFKNIGSGTEKIEREAARTFGNGALVRIDERTFQKADQVKPYEAALQAGILVGTPSILNIGALRDISLIAIMDADNFLSFPDFQADERFLRIVARSSLVTGMQGSVYIQTFRPEREALGHIAAKTVAALFEKTTQDRKMLRYPPHYRMFRITVRDKTESSADTLAAEASAHLTTAAATLKNVRVTPPMKPILSKVRGRFERIILITVKRADPFPTELEHVLLSEPNVWTFDPDPLSLL